MDMLYPEHEKQLRDKMGRYRTASLFREGYSSTDKDDLSPLWTLKDRDPKGKLPSLRRAYIDSLDPTEYTIALQAFGSWTHWEKLRRLNWFSEHVDEWAIELEVALRSSAVKEAIDSSRSGKTRFSAAKWIAEGGYKGAKRGRPSKAEKERALKIEARLQEEVEGDAERIGLVVDNTGTYGRNT